MYHSLAITYYIGFFPLKFLKPFRPTIAGVTAVLLLNYIKTRFISALLLYYSRMLKVICNTEWDRDVYLISIYGLVKVKKSEGNL